MRRQNFRRDAVGVCLATLVPEPARCSRADLERLAPLLSDAGFGAVSLWAEHVIDNGPDVVRQVLGDAGIAVRAIETLTPWQAGPDSVGDDAQRRLDCAAAIGAGLVLAATREPVLDVPLAAAGLAALGEHAARLGIAITIEYVPGRSLGDLATAWRVVEESGAPNVGLVVDFVHWYHQAGGPNPDLLATIPGAHLNYVQLADTSGAPRTTSTGGVVTGGRLMPGDGVAAVAAVLDLVAATGADPFVAFEIFNAEMLARGPEWMVARMRAVADELFT